MVLSFSVCLLAADLLSLDLAVEQAALLSAITIVSTALLFALRFFFPVPLSEQADICTERESAFAAEEFFFF